MAVKSKVLFSFLSAVGAYQLTGMAGINDDYNTLYKGSAEKKSKPGSQARKGNLLEEKRGWLALKENQHSLFLTESFFHPTNEKFSEREGHVAGSLESGGLAALRR